MELKTSKILIVGEDNDNFVMMKSLINDAFSEIVILSSNSEKQALEIVESEDIDVILIDIPMSKMEGFELCKRIKDDHKLNYISVGIVTSIVDLNVNRIKALEHGAETLLLKPIDEIDFIAQVRALLKIRIKNIKKRDENQELIDLIKSDHSLIEANSILKNGEKNIIRSSEVFNRNIIESTNDGFWVVDLKGQLLVVNQAYCRMTGYTKKELLSMSINDLDVIESPKDTELHIKNIKENGSDLFITRHKKKDGTLIDIEVSATFSDIDDVTFAFCRDITEQLQIKDALMVSEKKFRLITENIKDVISIFNVSKNKLTYISPSILTLRGFTVEEALSGSIDAAVSTESHEMMDMILTNNMHDFLNNPKTTNNYINDIKQPCKNSKDIWVEISTSFQYNTEGELEALSVSRSINEWKISEEMLLQSEEKFRMLFDKAPLGYQSLDINGNFINVNEQWLKMLGYKRSEVIGKWFGDFLSPLYQDGFRQRFPIFKAQGFIYSEFEMVKKNKKTIFIAFDGKIGYNNEHEFQQTHCILKDITVQRDLEDQLKQSEELYKSLFEYSGLAVGFYKPDGTVISYNQLASQNMGGNVGDYDGKSIYEIFPKASADIYMSRILKAISAESSDEYIDFVSLESGDKWFSSTFTKIINQSDEVIGVQIISNDITQAIKMENDLKASEKMYRLITENGNDVVTIYNITKNMHTYVSPSVQKMRGFTAEEVRRLKFEDSIAPEIIAFTISTFTKNMHDFLHNPQTTNNYRYETRQSCKNGQYVWVEVSSIYQYNDENELETVNNIRNIEERKTAEERLMHLSYYDQLTDLYNRRFYEEELMRLDTERNLPIALIMADVNGLKLTNDAFGHQEGDQILRNIAQIFKKVCRSDEIISRIGGDEFVILLPKCNDTQTRLLIERLNGAISNDKKNNALLSVSIGYAVKESVLMKMDAVFKEAEDDMYRHKLAENLSMRSKNIDLIMNSLFEKSNRERIHSDRVSEICEKIAFNMNINQEGIKQIKIAAVLHDIGKIGISDSILNKKGKLDTSEWEEMKKHSEIGYRILSTVSEFSEIAEYVLSHQEKWDGNGYPYNLKGEEIPIQARIIAIADAFDAMTVKRTYRDAMSETEAVAEIKRYAGTQFDPEIARIFIEKVMKLPW